MLLYQKESLAALLTPWVVAGKLYRHRQLLWKFTWRNIEQQHKGSLLGLAWSVLNPLCLFAVYAFVFIAVFNGRFGVRPTETRLDYAIGLFLGLSLVQLFQESMTVAPLVIVQNTNYVKKVLFPLEILPLAAFCAAFFRCLVSLTLVLLAVVVWGPGLDATAWWLPVLLVMLGLLSLGVAWILAALGVFLRDLAPLMQFFSVLLMFTSAVFYSFDRIPGKFAFLRFNPLLIVVESGRGVLLWHVSPTGGDLWYLGVVATVTCLAGYAIFCSVKPAFSDVL